MVIDELRNKRTRPRVPLVTRVVSLCVRLIVLFLAVVLLHSGLSKISNPYLFLSSVYGYELLSAKAGQAVAIVLPCLELVLGVCLLGRLLLDGSLAVSTVLFATFTGVQFSAVSRALDIPCGCFGGLMNEEVSHATVARAGMLLAASIAASVWQLARLDGDGRARALVDSDSSAPTTRS